MIVALVQNGNGSYDRWTGRAPEAVRRTTAQHGTQAIIFDEDRAQVLMVYRHGQLVSQGGTIPLPTGLLSPKL